MKTYVVYSIANRQDIAYFDFTLNYDNDVIAEESIPTSILDKGYFSSVLKSSYHKIQNTYNGPAIGKRGRVASTKFSVPMDTESIYDKVTCSNAVIRNANGVTLSSTSITLDEEVLLGDVDLNGVVNEADATLIMSYLGNRDAYPLNEKQRDAADVYSRGDGITNSDALEIQKYVLGMVSHF